MAGSVSTSLTLNAAPTILRPSAVQALQRLLFGRALQSDNAIRYR